MTKFFGGPIESKTFKKELELFSSEEIEILRQNFKNLANGQRNVERSMMEAAISKLLSVPNSETMARRLCDLMTGQMMGMQHITYEGYCHCAAIMVKGMLEDKAAQVLYLVTGRKSYGTNEEFFDFTKLMLQIYLQICTKQQALQWWGSACSSQSTEGSIDRLVEAFLRDLPGNPLPTARYDCQSVLRWLSKCYQVAEMHTVISNTIFHLPCGPVTPFIPLCRGIPARVYPTWLDMGDVIFINTALPSEMRTEWRFLFSNRIYGESFSSLVGCIVDKGPSILVIKDQNGHIFGGFASTSWTLNPHFAGSERDFMFSLHPRMAIYPTTGFNNHYHYLNTHQQTMPNGLGMGGQFDYFGLWIDADYGKGKCAPSCTTFGCPQLSGTPEFKIDRLEVWGVGPEPSKADDSERESRPSVLDSDVEGIAMLRMLNRGPVSEGLRENPTSDVPEDKSLHQI